MGTAAREYPGMDDNGPGRPAVPIEVPRRAGKRTDTRGHYSNALLAGTKCLAEYPHVLLFFNASETSSIAKYWLSALSRAPARGGGDRVGAVG